MIKSKATKARRKKLRVKNLSAKNFGAKNLGAKNLGAKNLGAKRLRVKQRRKRREPTTTELAAAQIEPWAKDEHQGPSHETWYKWNNQHGAMLRLASRVMTKDKNELADFALSLEHEGLFQTLRRDLATSAEFFRDMAQVLEAANFRLLVGAAVCVGQNKAGGGEDRLD